LKCPEDLLPILGREQGYITAADGKALRDWVDGAKVLDPEVERARNMLRTTTEQGMLALQAAWKSLPAHVRKGISPSGCPADLKASAEAFDKMRAEGSSAAADLGDINDAIADAGLPDDGWPGPDVPARAAA
jgi:hypothetical protein